tara:strand:+ start:907 stop:1278 length:372 start_codon:yes stop_codon:yes gene_type:complete
MYERTSLTDKYKMNGKGDRNRVSNWGKFYEGYNRIFRPKEPFYTDIKEYESRFRGGKIDSIQESTSEDVGANPTSSNGTVAQQAEHLICNQTVAGSIPVSTSTIDSAPFRAPPIRHGIRKIIE